MEKELINLWKSSPDQEKVKFELSRLMLDVQANAEKLHRDMKWLYLREGLGAIIAIPMFSYYAYVAPYVLTKIAFGLIAMWAAYILYVIKKSKEKIPDQFSVNYLNYLQKTEEYLEDQMRLRENIIYWYVLPFISFIYLGLLGTYLAKPEGRGFLLIVAIICFWGSLGVYFLNKRSAKKYVKPKLEKVRNLIAALEN